MKRFICSALLISGFLLPAIPQAFAQETAAIPVHVFVREGCTHCADEEAFFTDLSKQRDDFSMVYHDIGAPEERAIFDAITERAKLPKATPVTFIGGIVVQGFSTPDTTGKHLTDLIEDSMKRPTITLEEFLNGNSDVEVSLRDEGCDETGENPCKAPTSAYLVHIPFTGAVDMHEFSLPVISAILGFVDDFNPCAMWVLVTFLLILLQLNNRKKVWQVAGLFIAAETIMYYLILNVWFTAWDFIGLDKIVTPIVGLVAIAAGFYFLYEAWTSDGTCKVTSLEQQKKTNLKIKNIAAMPFTFATALAVIGLALSVNIIEFACSTGIPQTFTKILDINALSFVGRQGLMALYIAMYMIDDIIVFGIALWSVEHIHAIHKYSRTSNVIGGIIMILLGAVLVFNPGLLRFG